MDNLISNSTEVIKENDSNLEVIYGWMDIGSNICEKQRSNTPLQSNEIDIVNKLTSMMNQIKLVKDIVLYRGVSEEFDSEITEEQFNILSPDLFTAKSYGNGERVIKIIVPKGSNIFYVSAWLLIDTEVDRSEGNEIEVVLFPGRITLIGKKDTNPTYLYKQFLKPIIMF